MAAQSEATAAKRVTHTPGPWTIDDESKLGGQVYIWSSPASIASASIALVYPNRQREANARLIAKAPEQEAIIAELVGALKLIVYRYECRADGDVIGPEEIEEANAAIAKATK